jgi:YesN/AraC family two-component response regulator
MMRVMVVEDEEMIRRGIVMAVDWAALDCIVVGEAANGEQALAVAEDCQPTLIITDLKMPKMDGLEMVRRSRQPRVCHHSDRLRFVRLRADGHPSGRGGLSAEAFS